MKLFLKQEVWTFADRFYVYDQDGNVLFQVQGEVFTLGKKLHICSCEGEELAYIRQELLTFLPRFNVAIDGVDVAQVVKEWSFLKPEYRVDGPDWRVHGEFWAHDYQIVKGNFLIAAISKHWFTWGDTYEIDVTDDADALAALAVVLSIDAVLQQQSNS